MTFYCGGGVAKPWPRRCTHSLIISLFSFPYFGCPAQLLHMNK